MTRYERRTSIIYNSLVAPYEVQQGYCKRSQLVHMCGVINVPDAIKVGNIGIRQYVNVTCCRLVDVAETKMPVINAKATCLRCASCSGCPACVENYICDATMCLGKWTTQHGLQLYPFEMTDAHVLSTFRKLESEQGAFITDWTPWIAVFTAEARLRGLR